MIVHCIVEFEYQFTFIKIIRNVYKHQKHWEVYKHYIIKYNQPIQAAVYNFSKVWIYFFWFT